MDRPLLSKQKYENLSTRAFLFEGKRDDGLLQRDKFRAGIPIKLGYQPELQLLITCLPYHV